MYNVLFRHVCATTDAVENLIITHLSVCVCMCVCVFVALGRQHAVRMRYIVICGLPHSTVFFHIIS